MVDLLSPRGADFAEKRRILQLETLYDLALALRAERSEEDLVEELLQRVCTVLDPAAAFEALHDVQTAIVVPTVLQAIMEQPGWPDAVFPELRALSIGSTDVPRDLIEHVFQERYACNERSCTAAVEIDFDGNPGLAGVALDARVAGRHGGFADRRMRHRGLVDLITWRRARTLTGRMSFDKLKRAAAPRTLTDGLRQ